jgi:hypothetical protein
MGLDSSLLWELIVSYVDLKWGAEDAYLIERRGQARKGGSPVFAHGIAAWLEVGC